MSGKKVAGGGVEIPFSNGLDVLVNVHHTPPTSDRQPSVSSGWMSWAIVPNSGRAETQTYGTRNNANHSDRCWCAGGGDGGFPHGTRRSVWYIVGHFHAHVASEKESIMSFRAYLVTISSDAIELFVQALALYLVVNEHLP